jgi:MFS family permease
MLITKTLLTVDAWESWGWRIPFLMSAFMVIISVWIRKNMSESPLFARAKAEGKTSANPLKDSFGNRANLKMVLLALFGLLMGIGVVGYSSTFYSQSFLIKFMFVDYDQANKIVITAIFSGIPLTVFFGWLSDRIGRKYLLLTSLFLAIICFRPVFDAMYQTANLQHKVEDIAAMQTNSKTVSVPSSTTDSLITTTILHSYTDGTESSETKTQLLVRGIAGKPETITSIKLNSGDEWKLIRLIFLLAAIFTMSYGPLAAYVVEMFPLKIRYTSMSLPYHLGYGVFGGMSVVIGTYLIEKAKAARMSDYYLEGLSYPITLMCISLVIGLLYLRENKGTGVARIHSPTFNQVKRLMGYVWILLGLVAAYLGVFKIGIPKLMSGSQDDLIFGFIVMFIITPVAGVGLFMFGKYAIDGEYDEKAVIIKQSLPEVEVEAVPVH